MANEITEADFCSVNKGGTAIIRPLHVLCRGYFFDFTALQGGDKYA